MEMSDINALLDEIKILITDMSLPELESVADDISKDKSEVKIQALQIV